MAGNSFFGSSGLLNSCDKLKVGDTVIVGACVTWFTGAGKGSLLEISNFLKNHHAPTKAVTPTPEKSHSLFLTSQFHIKPQSYSSDRPWTMPQGQGRRAHS